MSVSGIAYTVALGSGLPLPSRTIPLTEPEFADDEAGTCLVKAGKRKMKKVATKPKMIFIHDISISPPKFPEFSWCAGAGLQEWQQFLGFAPGVELLIPRDRPAKCLWPPHCRECYTEKNE
jgi:hypothetical protein